METKGQKKELVNHPDYYNREIECIEEMRLVFGDEETAIFCKLNAWKYRYGRIGKPAVDVNTDLQKSDWYMGYFQDLKELNKSEEKHDRESQFRVLRQVRAAAKENEKFLKGTVEICWDKREEKSEKK